MPRLLTIKALPKAVNLAAIFGWVGLLFVLFIQKVGSPDPSLTPIYFAAVGCFITGVLIVLILPLHREKNEVNPITLLPGTLGCIAGILLCILLTFGLV